MSYTLGVLFFVIALLVSVMLHEAGHFLTARAFGMKASRFFVGFGPTLWSTHRGETEYGVKAIPAGGFVKIVGMTDLEEIEPGDEGRAFYRQPAPQKLVVLSAGSVVHRRSIDARKAASVLPEPVGAAIRTLRPAATCGQARACAGVGAANALSNQAETAG